jgi:type VI protein secretion system component Hcp
MPPGAGFICGHYVRPSYQSTSGNTMQLHTRSSFAALLCVLTFAGASNAWADTIYMHVIGVVGPVTVAPYQGDIEILSYSQGFSNPVGSSTPQCSDTSIQKSIDVTSQFFARSVLDQSTMPFTAILYFVNTSAVADTTIRMNSVTVTSVSHGASEGGGSISEAISMHATSLTVTFTDGTVKRTYTTSCP